MELHQLNNQDLSNDAIIELLTLDCEVSKYGTRCYYNKEGQRHRIHGPAFINNKGVKYWFKNGLVHREDGPAIVWGSDDGSKEYYINSEELTKEEFIQWQKENGIKPIE